MAMRFSFQAAQSSRNIEVQVEKLVNQFDQIEELEDFLSNEISQKANHIDKDSQFLKEAFNELNVKVFTKVLFNEDFELTNRVALGNYILEKIAEFSGALAFISAQYVGAAVLSLREWNCLSLV